jgi:hypothetical protein
MLVKLDDDLLQTARERGERLADAEKHADLARADYHATVRRLHLAGGSLREIAEALSVSHQRVKQIVDAAGGTWWSRVWRTRTVKRDAVCTFCERPPSEVSKLIAGPDVYVCDACVSAAERCAASSTRYGALMAGAPKLALAAPKARVSCAFCGNRPSTERALITGAAANVCVPCLRLCREILDGREA